MTETNDPPIKTGVIVFDAVNECIYCRSRAEPLRREHIIAFALGGTFVLPKASCDSCGAVTGRTEQEIARSMYGTLRAKLDFPTRRKKERGEAQPMQYLRVTGPNFQQEKSHVVEIPNAQLPLVCVTLELPPPRILSGEKATGSTQIGIGIVAMNPELTNLLAHGEGVGIGQINPHIFCRMLAKIAHSFAVAEVGLCAFRPLLLDIIFGRSNDVWHLIGGVVGPHVADHIGMHRLRRLEYVSASGQRYVGVNVRLFAPFNTPEYIVVVGECLPH